jgi:hypothetical protein
MDALPVYHPGVLMKMSLGVGIRQEEELWRRAEIYIFFGYRMLWYN